MLALAKVCARRLHCETCRDRETGREWRKSLGQYFEVPAGAPDFDCPHGLAWGWRPTWTHRLRRWQRLRWGDRIAAITHAFRIPQCGGCKKRQEWLNQRRSLGAICVDLGRAIAVTMIRRSRRVGDRRARSGRADGQ
jgi:hypothetical protein